MVKQAVQKGRKENKKKCSSRTNTPKNQSRYPYTQKEINIISEFTKEGIKKGIWKVLQKNFKKLVEQNQPDVHPRSNKSIRDKYSKYICHQNQTLKITEDILLLVWVYRHFEVTYEDIGNKLNCNHGILQNKLMWLSQQAEDKFLNILNKAKKRGKCFSKTLVIQLQFKDLLKILLEEENMEGNMLPADHENGTLQKKQRSMALRRQLQVEGNNQQDSNQIQMNSKVKVTLQHQQISHQQMVDSDFEGERTMHNYQPRDCCPCQLLQRGSTPQFHFHSRVWARQQFCQEEDNYEESGEGEVSERFSFNEREHNTSMFCRVDPVGEPTENQCVEIKFVPSQVQRTMMLREPLWHRQ